MPIEVEHDGERRPVCCHGCQAVSELIFSTGLNRYYQFRTAQARRADDDLERVAAAWAACDQRPDLWGEEAGDGLRDLLLQTEGVSCAACAWLIRSRLEPREGVERVQVDVGSGYTRILWNPGQTTLRAIATELTRIGYRPHLPLAEAEERERLNARRSAMLRLGVAGLGMMQVMMYAVGLYAGEALGISLTAQRFLEWTSLLVSIPVVLYSARPFFTAAAASLRAGRLNMDVPVALAIGIAFLASCFNFLRGQGEVYFDSVVMFVFFLASARYIQMVQSHRNLQGGAALARLLPEWAFRLPPGDGEAETVLASELQVGDRVRVRTGEPFPADGTLLLGATQVDEALLTGESVAVERGPGEAVVGGSINRGQPVEVQVTAVGRDLTVSALGRMLLKAGAGASRFVSSSERIAGVFVAAVLIIAMLTAGAWLYLEPEHTLSAVLAVLVVSCPCALSLAAPAAIAAAGRKLVGQGVLMSNGDALEALAEVDLAVFDKTGTLTCGRPEVAATVVNASSGISEQQALAMAAALEAHSAHPLARAFRSAPQTPVTAQVERVEHGGVRGLIDGQTWAIGSAEFTGMGSASQDSAAVWLTNASGWVARFELRDETRPEAKAMLRELEREGVEVAIASGDAGKAVSEVANRLGINQWFWRQDPAAKMDRVRDWQSEGRRVLMVGDGVNDAPVLAAADVSMTVPGASDLANSAADFIITGESLAAVGEVRKLAQATRRVVRQNLAWALVYNVVALPLAVSGLLEPWMAALGMSLSSLLVVANSARLARGDARQAPASTRPLGQATAA